MRLFNELLPRGKNVPNRSPCQVAVVRDDIETILVAKDFPFAIF